MAGHAGESFLVICLQDLILKGYDAKDLSKSPFFVTLTPLSCFKADFPLQTPASVMELVDVPDSKSGAARRGGSSPPRGTTDPPFATAHQPPFKLV